MGIRTSTRGRCRAMARDKKPKVAGRSNQKAETKQARARQERLGESYTTALSHVRKERLSREEKELNIKTEAAARLLRSGEFEEALPLYVWLWQHGLELHPDWHGVRVSFFTREVATLIKASPEAREVFSRLRDEARAAKADWDWAALNEALGEESKTLAMFEHFRERMTPEQLASRRHWWEGLLKTADRWAEVALLYPQPVEEIERVHAEDAHSLQVLQASRPGLVRAIAWHRETSQSRFAAVVNDLLRALEAAGRGSDALQVARRARELEPAPEFEALLARHRG